MNRKCSACIYNTAVEEIIGGGTGYGKSSMSAILLFYRFRTRPGGCVEVSFKMLGNFTALALAEKRGRDGENDDHCVQKNFSFI